MSQRRLKLVLAYDGQDFAGWQSQKHGRTIQDEVENVFRRLVGTRVVVVGAGRTDAGVHALGQCAHADVPAQKFAPAGWLFALNALLPSSIRILRARWVPATFHARFAAKGKTYRYRIATSPVLSPFKFGRAWHVKESLDRALLVEAAHAFLGTHDFVAFSANRGSAPTNTVRTITAIRVRSGPERSDLIFTGDGFLYKMVRLMAGAAVNCALGKETVEETVARLGGRERLGPRFVAPAAGLCLIRVRY